MPILEASTNSGVRLTRGGAAVPLAGLNEGEGDSLTTFLPVCGRVTFTCRG